MAPESATADRPATREILTVSALNRAVAGLLERSIPPVWVAGEVSNFARAASGHWYFTLKDADAQVRAVMFRGRNQAVDFGPRDGDRVEVRGLVSLYQPRGDFQLNVELMRRAGAGDLYQRFLQLKEKLQREGLLDEGRKRVPPRLPACVGVITSPQAAALRDVLTTLRRRAPQVPVVLYPSPVQGADAPASLVAALTTAARRAECDVLLLVRGGGSIEDLWAFNDEVLARAVAASPIPVICGVGHESDFTIADFVADVRAATPTAAATLAVPDRAELAERLRASARRASHAFARVQQAREQRLDTAARLLRSPSAYWQGRALAMRGLAERLRLAARRTVQAAEMRAAGGALRLQAPDTTLAGRRLASEAERMARAGAVLARRRADHLSALEQHLALVSPEAVLRRGYAIVQRADGEIVRTAARVADDERLHVRLAQGSLDVRVEARRSAEGEGR